MWLGPQSVSSLERCPLFRVSFIARFHCISVCLQSLVAFPKMKRQVLLMDPEAQSGKDLTPKTVFWVNQEFALV